jgi:hypothetical protein
MTPKTRVLWTGWDLFRLKPCLAWKSTSLSREKAGSLVAENSPLRPTSGSRFTLVTLKVKKKAAQTGPLLSGAGVGVGAGAEDDGVGAGTEAEDDGVG